jgi:hypothetical protein
MLALGLGTIDHTEPFHTIANVSVAEPVLVDPTATHSNALTHDTAFSPLSPATLGLGITTAESTTAPAGVDTTTPPNTIAVTANIARTDLRTIRKPFDQIVERPFAGRPAKGSRQWTFDRLIDPERAFPQ